MTHCLQRRIGLLAIVGMLSTLFVSSGFQSGPVSAINADGNIDAVFGAQFVENRSCLGDGSGGFVCSDVSVDTNLSRGAALGDLDGDGDNDAVFANFNATNRVCLSDGAGVFTCADISLDGGDGRAVDLADLNGDGNLDAVIANNTQPNLACLGDGAGAFTGCSAVSADAFQTFGVALGDVNGDNNVDAVFANLNQINRVCLGDGAGGFSGCSDVSAATNGTASVAVGDVDGDNDLDVVFGNGSSQLNQTCLNDGAGAFTCSNSSADANVSWGTSLADLNGDGMLDVVFANHAQSNQSCIGDNSGTFVCSNIAFVGGNNRTRAVDVADVDNDGDIDAVFGEELGADRVCLNDGTGAFSCSDVSADPPKSTWSVALSAAPSGPTGCFVDAPGSVDEAATFTATVRCAGVDDMFGFEFGTTLTGDGSTTATSYAPGEFETGSTGAVLTGSNSLATFAQSHTGTEVSSGSYTLGSYDVVADSYLTADGSVSITLDDFLASDSSGAALAALAASPDATITINNIILTLLSGDVTLASDGAMTNLSNAVLTLDGTSHPAASGAGSSVAVTVNQQGSVLDIAVSADMDSHLACSETTTIADGVNDAATAIGTLTLLAGDVVSVGGDEAINLQDAVAIGAVFGGTATGEEDVNGDGNVNIFDLVHIGRNYLATNATCS
ncbi:MAG: VCBS repeat-containing protein [Ilumatobacter sp.]|nr:VCBS repeat-containing protein [Ilumatobacter sp.]